MRPNDIARMLEPMEYVGSEIDGWDLAPVTVESTYDRASDIIDLNERLRYELKLVTEMVVPSREFDWIPNRQDMRLTAAGRIKRVLYGDLESKLRALRAEVHCMTKDDVTDALDAILKDFDGWSK